MSDNDLSYRDRVRDELKELQGRIAKLEAFIEESDVFAALRRTEQYLLERQLAAMENYRNALLARIGLWSLTKTE